MEKKITPIVFTFLIGLTCLSFAQKRVAIGSVESVFNSLANSNAITVSAYQLRTNTGDLLSMNVSDYYLKDGQLSVTGKVNASGNSLFFIKGNQESLYGIVRINDTRKAYEYTTVNGMLVVDEVPIAKINPDLFGDEMPFPTNQNTNSPMGVKVYSPMAQGQLPHIGPYKSQDLLKLESRPGSKYVFYCNITAIMNGSTPKYVSAEEMYKNWQCVADQYSMYDVNITTNKAIYTAAGVPNSGILGYLDEDGRSNADLNSFGTSSASRVYKNVDAGPWGYGIGRTAAHEGGHQMGLQHDGGTGGEYFVGLPAFQWCPIMGNYWYGNNWDQALYQWSKGEYTTATQKQDDLVQIKSHVPYLADDISGTKAMVIGTGGAVSPTDNWGIINSSSDTDVFTFELTSAGHIKLKLDPIEYVGMLDIDAKIIDGSGTQKAQSNLAVNRSASFDLDLAAGSYKLEIKGGAEGTPANGFSTYSSMGYYAMEGSITGTVGVEKSFLENSISIYPNPTVDIAYLHIPTETNITRISLSSVDGKVVFDSPSRISQIDLSGLSRGIYFLKIQTDHEIVNRKISKL